MLPVRKSSPVRRSTAIAVEIRVPSSGETFVALASRVEAESVLVSMFVELEAGTPVVLVLSQPDGRADADGVVSARPTPGGAVVIELADLAEPLRARLARVA